MSHTLKEWMDRELIGEQEVELPEALKGLSIRGFLLSDDRRACITIEPKEKQ